MTSLDFKELFVRELDNLHKEISAFADEGKLWLVKGEVKNCPGNLCLHLLGNVNHFIGATLGKTGYVRNREEEFSLKNISKQKLLGDITAAKAMVEKTFSNMDSSELQKDFPFELFGKRSTEYMLSYFFGHFMYHMGQINYHRRLI
jgi:uncharacterized damage-inducible protein DinB